MPRRRHAKPEPFRYAFPSIAPALPAPFATQDNGVHRYFEDRDVVVFCNHGSSIWTGLGKDGGALEVLANGEYPAEVMSETRRLRAIPRSQRLPSSPVSTPEERQ